MSSDVDDDQILPDSLQKLEIVPVYSRAQLLRKTTTSNDAQNQNPFSLDPFINKFDESVSKVQEYDLIHEFDMSEFDFCLFTSIRQVPKDLFGPTCTKCGNRNDSVCKTFVMIDGAKFLSTKNPYLHRKISNQIIGEQTVTGSERNTQKQIHFKHREKPQIFSEKKLTILREPILKSIGRSIYHNTNRNRICCDASTIGIDKTLSMNAMGNNVATELGNKSSASNSTDQDYGFQVRSTVETNNVMNNKIQRWQLDDDLTVDFKSLVNDCSNMSLRTTLNTIHRPNDELHKTKNFQIFQKSVDASTSADYHDAESEQETNISNLAILSNSNGINNTMNNSLSNSNSTSTCSQQARMNSGNCDVTIDELASYFETFVHIPKKMSSMAEMMYI